MPKTEWKEQLKQLKENVSTTNQIQIEDKDLGEYYKSPKYKPVDLQNIETEEEQINYEEKVDKPANVLVEEIRNQDINPAELSVEERIVVVQYLRDVEFLTQDQCGEFLGVSRRTIANYMKRIRKRQEYEFKQQNVQTISAEIWRLFEAGAQQALASNRPDRLASIIREAILVLQNLGVLPRVASKQKIESRSQNLNYNINAYQDYQNQVQGEEISLEAVLSDVLEAAKQGKLDALEDKSKQK